MSHYVRVQQTPTSGHYVLTNTTCRLWTFTNTVTWWCVSRGNTKFRSRLHSVRDISFNWKFGNDTVDWRDVSRVLLVVLMAIVAHESQNAKLMIRNPVVMIKSFCATNSTINDLMCCMMHRQPYISWCQVRYATLRGGIRFYRVTELRCPFSIHFPLGNRVWIANNN